MAQAHADADKYYIPHSSPWPIYGSLTLFTLMSGAVATLDDWLPAYALLPGFIMLVLLFVFWFHTVIGENQAGIYNLAVDRSFRMGMMWFIFSEVMFFAAFFGALSRESAFVVLATVFGGLIAGRLVSLGINGGFAGYGPTIVALYAIDALGFVLSVTAFALNASMR